MLTEYQFLVIEPSGELRWIESNPFRLLDDFYKAIGCDCVENVRTLIPDVCLIVDDIGKLKNPPQLVNPVASKLYAGSYFGDPIVGPAVVAAIHLVDGESDWVPLNEKELDRLQQFLGIEILF